MLQPRRSGITLAHETGRDATLAPTSRAKVETRITPSCHAGLHGVCQDHRHIDRLSLVLISWYHEGCPTA